MKDWLAEKFVALGIAATVFDVSSRIFSNFGIDYVGKYAVQESLTLEQSLHIAQAFGLVDVLASAFWWAFIFGLAFRILAYLERLGSAERQV